MASQALPNVAQIALSLGQNFYDVFMACPDTEQQSLLQDSQQLSRQGWNSIRGQVACELGEEYAQALDQVRQAMQEIDSNSTVSQRQEAFRQGLERNMSFGVNHLLQHQRIGRGITRSMMMSQSESTPPPRSQWPPIPGYELTGWLGEGAQAKVFIAKREDAGEQSPPIALKVGPLTDRARFENEIAIMKSLRSPYLLSANNYGVIEGFVSLFWIEMPLMAGATLAGIGQVDLEEGIKLCLGVIEGLKVLHEAGVAHRDLKPENVLLTVQGKIKLADFGLSKRQREGSISNTKIIGSPAYMSPEAFAGQSSLASDVWSLGVLIHFVLTQKYPFKGEHEYAIVASILKDAPDLGALPKWLQPGIKACLTKELSQRPKNIKGLSSILETPMRKYLAQLEKDRELKRQRTQRINQLNSLLKNEDELKIQLDQEILRMLNPMTKLEIAQKLQSLFRHKSERLFALRNEQSEYREELKQLENIANLSQPESELWEKQAFSTDRGSLRPSKKQSETTRAHHSDLEHLRFLAKKGRENRDRPEIEHYSDLEHLRHVAHLRRKLGFL